MGEALSTAGKRAIALLVLLLVAFVLFKVILGIVTFVGALAVPATV